MFHHGSHVLAGCLENLLTMKSETLVAIVSGGKGCSESLTQNEFPHIKQRLNFPNIKNYTVHHKVKSRPRAKTSHEWNSSNTKWALFSDGPR